MGITILEMFILRWYILGYMVENQVLRHSSYVSLILGIFHAVLLSADFFKINFFEKFFQELRLECQTDWIQIRPDVLLGLIWVQTVCKGYK